VAAVRATLCGSGRRDGFHREQVLPRITNVARGRKSSDPLRERVCHHLADRFAERFGSGSNIRFYPAAVTEVAAVSPPTSAGSWPPNG
jgi:hypothetical protein